MAMMPPAKVVAPIPTVMVAATAVMAPTMPMAALDLNHGPIGPAQRMRCCHGHSQRWHSWHEPKSTAGKSDYQKPLHSLPPPSWQNAPADYQLAFAIASPRQCGAPGVDRTEVEAC